MIDPTIVGALSVASLVAMRRVTPDEIDNIKRANPGSLEEVSAVMGRIRFVDAMRYSIPLDTLDLVQCMHRDALETYLLCTCLDTLAGTRDFYELHTWLCTDRPSVRGVQERRKLVEAGKAAGDVVSPDTFSRLISQALQIYHRSYGTNQRVAQLLQDLPADVAANLAASYKIHRETPPDVALRWDALSVGDKLRTIFIDYLIPHRRNSYTHRAEASHGFGGTRAMRESLRAGNIDLPSPQTRHVRIKAHDHIVTCLYGDEALFLRESLCACLAWKLGVLDTGWSLRYRQAERQKRLVHALVYELTHNIQVIQFYFDVLSDTLLSRAGDNDGWPILEINIGRSIRERTAGEKVSLLEMQMDGYVQAGLLVNARLEHRGDNGRIPNATRFRNAIKAIQESDFRRQCQLLIRLSAALLEDYPVWTYDECYSPRSGGP